MMTDDQWCKLNFAESSKVLVDKTLLICGQGSREPEKDGDPLAILEQNFHLDLLANREVSSAFRPSQNLHQNEFVCQI